MASWSGACGFLRKKPTDRRILSVVRIGDCHPLRTDGAIPGGEHGRIRVTLCARKKELREPSGPWGRDLVRVQRCATAPISLIQNQDLGLLRARGLPEALRS